MEASTLKFICQLRGLSQSDLARAAGVSRQAVSLWFKEAKLANGQINLQSKHQKRMAKSLNISLDLLTEALPIYDNEHQLKVIEASFLWDKLYPSLASFLAALVDNQPRAMARLVEHYGLFKAAAVMGKAVWQKFLLYKKYMGRRQRTNWERVWNLQQNLGLN